MAENLEARMDALWQKSALQMAAAKEQSLIEAPQNSSRTVLAKWFQTEIQKANQEIDRAEEEMGLKCVCGKGCDACCKQAIQVLPVEAKAISAVINCFSIEEKEALSKRVEAWLAKIKESGLDTDQNKYYTSSKEFEKIYAFMAAYFKLGLCCPLLSEEGACMIYPVRPGGCWSYRVYGNPEACKEAYSAPFGMKHDEWERYLLDQLYKKVKPEHTMKLLPYYIDDILKHRL